MCECLMDGFSHQDKCPIDFSESGHLSFKEQVLAPSLPALSREELADMTNSTHLVTLDLI